MDAVEFVKERNRMCSTYMPKRCEGCPADNYGKEGRSCIMIDEIDAERLVSIVEEWSVAHPRKTRQSVFLKQYPEASIGNDGVLRLCPFLIDASYRNNDGSCKSMQRQCSDCRKKYWLQEVE